MRCPLPFNMIVLPYSRTTIGSAQHGYSMSPVRMTFQLSRGRWYDISSNSTSLSNESILTVKEAGYGLGHSQIGTSETRATGSKTNGDVHPITRQNKKIRIRISFHSFGRVEQFFICLRQENPLPCGGG